MRRAVALGLLAYGGFSLFYGLLLWVTAGFDLLALLFLATGSLAFAFPFAWAGWRGLRGREDVAPTDAERARVLAKVPVATPGTDEVADLRTPIQACPECGFLGIRPPGIRDGTWAGGGEIMSDQVCPRCGYRGIPIAFDSGAAYAAFVRALHEARTTPTGS